MAFTRSPLSLNTASTGVVNGRSVGFRKGACTRLSAQVTVTASTKASYRLQGSIDGIHFVNLGASATTFSSTSGAQQITSTSTVAYPIGRVVQTAMAAKTGAAAVASITGY